MKRERLCEYGSCHNTNVAVTVNVIGDPSERPAFCSTQHAALWLATHHLPLFGNREAIKTELERVIAQGRIA